MGTILVLAWLGAAVGVQEGSESVTRFDRIHLRNGNFIDGAIVRETAHEVVLRIRGGEIALRREGIDRVEKVTMRSLPPARPPEPVTAARSSKPVSTRAPERVERPPAEGDTRGRVERLFRRLKEASPEHKHGVLRELEDAGRDAVLAACGLLDLLEDDDLAYAELVLRPLVGPESLETLRKPLGSFRADVRRTAAALASAVGTPEARGLLGRHLEDADARVREAVVAALEAAEDVDFIAPLARRVADADGEVRRRASAAAYAVASRMDRLHDLRRELLDLLERTAGEARADVVEALGRLEGADVERTLLAALEDEAPGVRAAAVRALARPAAAEALLARMAVEQDPRVRSELAGAVGSLKEPRAERALLGWLGDANRDVRAAAADALRRITGRAHDVDHDDCAECRRAEAEERR